MEDEKQLIEQMISGAEQSIARTKELLATFERQLVEAKQAMEDFITYNKE